jgi:hypothetical protein
VKKGIILCAGILFFLSACALFPRKISHITWPDSIEYLEALCELDMSWKDMKYSGSMSLKMEYPHKLLIEVYGPFGDTVVYIKRDRGYFMLVTKDERITDEKGFEERFDIKLDEFIGDIAMKGYEKRMPEGYVQRENYRVIYKIEADESRICWEGKDGSICVKFLEANFNKE